MQVKDSVTIVTGASSGIGYATAKLLHKKGAKLVLAARSKNKLEQLARDLRGSLVIVTDMISTIDTIIMERTEEIEIGIIKKLPNMKEVTDMKEKIGEKTQVLRKKEVFPHHEKRNPLLNTTISLQDPEVLLLSLEVTLGLILTVLLIIREAKALVKAKVTAEKEAQLQRAIRAEVYPNQKVEVQVQLKMKE